MSMNGIILGGQQGNGRNKRMKAEQGDLNSQKDDIGEYLGREMDEQAHGRGGNKQLMNRICRDFVRGLCRRKYCRYPHVLSPDLVVFCHDFQNTYCPRINCKFLHYSIEEEEHYRKYGEFPQTEEKEALPPPPPPQIYDRYNREFHYNNNNPNNRPRENEPVVIQQPFPPNNYRGNYDHTFMTPRDFHRRDDFGNGLKRPSSNAERYGDAFKRFCNANDDDQPDIMAVIRKFEEEQAMLRRRVEANEVKIAELRASNEFLLSQNAQIRMNTVQVSRVVSAVTNTATAAGQSQPAVINTVSMAPVQVTPIVSMTTAQQPTIIASAIAASTSQGQLTIAQPNISALNTSTQQLAPINQITLTPTLTHPGLATINTSQALAMSNGTIMTPTIMTHSILPH